MTPVILSMTSVIITGISILAAVIAIVCLLALKGRGDTDALVRSDIPPTVEPGTLPLKQRRPRGQTSKKPLFTLPEPSQAQAFVRPPLDAPDTNPAPLIDRHSLLVFQTGEQMGEKFSLDRLPEGGCAIGRSEAPENQLVIRGDNKVSRVKHAVITRDAQGLFYLQDNNSVNKVYVNGICIEDRKVALQNGDVIRIGITELNYVTESPI